MIHYSHYAIRGAARAPLFFAVASLALIAGMLGDPQAEAGTAVRAGMVLNDQPTISAPIIAPPHGPAAMPHLDLALVNRDRASAGLPLLSESRCWTPSLPRVRSR